MSLMILPSQTRQVVHMSIGHKISICIVGMVDERDYNGQQKYTTVQPRLSEPQLSEPWIIRILEPCLCAGRSTNIRYNVDVLMHS